MPAQRMHRCRLAGAPQSHRPAQAHVTNGGYQRVPGRKPRGRHMPLDGGAGMLRQRNASGGNGYLDVNPDRDGGRDVGDAPLISKYGFDSMSF